MSSFDFGGILATDSNSVRLTAVASAMIAAGNFSIFLYDTGRLEEGK